MSVDKTMVRTRKSKENPYVMLDKTGLHDTRLSWKAKGLHAYLMSLPDDWTIYISELTKHAKDGRDSTRAAFKELELAGYITNEAIRNEKGRIEKWEKIVYEQPLHWDQFEMPKTKKKKENDPETEIPYVDEIAKKPDTENPHLENPHLENPTLLINKDTDKLNVQNNDLNNMDGRLGKASPAQGNQSDLIQFKEEWELLKGICEKYDVNQAQAMEFYKAWRHGYSDAPIPIVIATIRELFEDQWTLKKGKWTQTQYKSVTGLFHHRMKSWREMAVAYEDVDGADRK